MNVLTAEWVDKAEGDFFSTQRECRARIYTNYDAACFHAQQSAEKYLKAYLQDHDITFPKTHNLIDLMELCLIIDPEFIFQRDLLVRLDRYAVIYHYPGYSADLDDAKQALLTVKQVRGFIRNKLGLKK